MYFTIRLLKRPDLDLITLYRGGIPVGDIFKKALYYYARGVSFRVAVEPVPPISLDEACERVITTSGYNPGTVVKRFVPIRINCTITDPESIKILKTARSAYGSTLCKQIVRQAVINLPVSSMMLYGAELRRTALMSDKRRRGTQDAALYQETVTETVSGITSREAALYEEALRSEESDMYIASRNGKLCPALKKEKAAPAPLKPGKEDPVSENASGSRENIQEPVIEKPSGITLPTAKAAKDTKEENNDEPKDELSFLLELGQQVLS